MNLEQCPGQSKSPFFKSLLENIKMEKEICVNRQAVWTSLSGIYSYYSYK